MPQRKVLILYQYEHGRTNSLQQRFVTETENGLNGATVQNIEIVAERLSKSGGASASATIYSEFVKAVNKYDYAIALFTVDRRPASEAGNLWFEVGYWYATRGGDSLLIVKHLVHQTNKPRLVIPSNLQGVVYREARTAVEVKSRFSDFLRDAEAHSRRRLIDGFGKKMLDSAWIISEKEDMRITEMPKPPQLLTPLTYLNLFSLISKVERTTYDRPEELSFYLLIAPFERSPRGFTYRQIFGAGRLKEKELEKLRQIVLDAPTDENGIPDLFEIGNLNVRTKRHKAKVRLAEVTAPDSSRRLVYRCEWDEMVEGPYTIELRSSQ
jgi:hypothetical protein